MNVDDVPPSVSAFSSLPRFPDGRIDYSGSDTAPVLTAFLFFGDQLLLLKRSQNVGAYKGLWNGVGGYLDEQVPLRQKVLEELREELSIPEERVVSMKAAEPMDLLDAEIGRRWIIHPVRVDIDSNDFTLDEEHTEARWIRPEELGTFDYVLGADTVLHKLL